MRLSFIIFVFSLCYCLNAQSGDWMGSLQADSVTNIPFSFNLDIENKVFTITNGDEKITIDDILITKDSVSFYFPVYNSKLRARYFENDLAKKLGRVVWTMDGVWEKYPGTGKYDIKFAAHTMDNQNLKPQRKPSSMDGKWAVKFSPDTDEEYPAIGEFKQDGYDVKGTFLTETGDFRFLSGKVFGNTFYLSCFDGSHAFLFKGDVFGNSMVGNFYSGKHWSEPFIADLDENASLPSPYELTYLVDGYETFDVTFPNLDNEPVSINEKPFKYKATVIQIFGTWCPNCKDETALLTDLYKLYKDKGVEFVGIAFERSENLDEAKVAIQKYIDYFDIQYPILFGGKANKSVASDKFPMLNHIMSFPTTIVLNNQHKVVKIHTGFNGPATSEYSKFVNEFTSLLNELTTK